MCIFYNLSGGELSKCFSFFRRLIYIGLRFGFTMPAARRWLLIVVVIVLMQPIDDRFTAKQTFNWPVQFIITFNKYDEYVTTVKCST